MVFDDSECMVGTMKATAKDEACIVNLGTLGSDTYV